jgi:beta-lactamase regulating signal transducer with metallopeptidase domain
MPCCCLDAWVLGAIPGSARTYAESLLKTLELVALAKQSPVPALASSTA